MPEHFNGDLNEVAKLYIEIVNGAVKGQRQTKGDLLKLDRQARSIFITEESAEFVAMRLRPDFTIREINLLFKYFKKLGWIRRPITTKWGRGMVSINGKPQKVYSFRYSTVNLLSLFYSKKKGE